jgi:hypothetical protein
MFIAKTPNAEDFPDYDLKDYAYQPGLYTDNPFLDEKYLKRLRNLEPARRKQLLEGDWSTFFGQFFDWSPALHITEMEPA